MFLKVSDFCNRICLLRRAFQILVGCAIVSFVEPAFAAANIFLYQVNDYAAQGCAYDPDWYLAGQPQDSAHRAPIQVHIYAEPPYTEGVIGMADRQCLWSADPNFAGHGFIIQFRRPVTDPSGVALAAIDHTGTPVWFSLSSQQSQVGGPPFTYNQFARSTRTVLVSTDNYQIGISKKYGAAVVEFYNKAFNSGAASTLNLIDSDVGAELQAAVFGDPSSSNGLVPNSGELNCAGVSPSNPNYAYQWNPTQAGSACPQADHSSTNSPTILCSSSWSDNRGCTQPTINIGTSGQDVIGYTGAPWIQWLVRFRNFFYPVDSSSSPYPYRPYDEVYGLVRYTFNPLYVQIDYKLWKDGMGAGAIDPAPSRGAFGQQLPVLYATQFSELRYKQYDSTRPTLESVRDWKYGDIGLVQNVFQAPITNIHDGRWVTMIADNTASGSDVLMEANVSLTAAFYSGPQGGACPTTRFFQAEFRPEAGGTFIQRQAIAQNQVLFEPSYPNYIVFRTLLFPFKNDDTPAGTGNKTVADWIDTSDASGGLKPAWECNNGAP